MSITTNEHPETESARLLLVDDEPDLLASLVDILEGEGFQTDIAATGKQALEKLRRRSYDLAILDIRLPDLEGTELLAHAKRLQPDLVCVMATGVATKESAVAALNQGAHAYFEKPIDVDQVLATIRTALQQQRRQRLNREMARTLVQSFLVETPRRKDVQLATRFAFASQAALVGGDYFDFIELDADRLGIVIGDVCGKGVPAAIHTGKAKDILYAYARLDPSPKWVITELNRALCPQMSEEAMFITMVYGVLDTRAGTFTYTNAGHPAPLVYHPPSDQFVELRAGGTIIGITEEASYAEETVPLESGDVLTLFTDGVTEARSDSQMLESEGVQAVIRAHAGQNAEGIANALYERAREFAGGVLRDDVAIVVLKNSPPPVSARGDPSTVEASGV